MKKTILKILILSFALILVGCNGGKDDNKKDETISITLTEVLTLVNKTKEEFLIAPQLNIALETEVNNKTALMLASYEIDGFNIETFKYRTSINNELYEVYIKESVQYVNFNNDKSKNSLSQTLERKIISEYSFVNLTNVFFSIHTNDYFNLLKVDSYKDGLVKLLWDKTKEDDKEVISYLKEELDFIQDIDSITVEIKILENKVIYVESLIVSGTEKVRFLLDFYAQEFLYPTDLDSYINQK